MPRSRKIAHSLCVAVALLCWLGAPPTGAQDPAPPDATARIYACGAALDRVTEAAEAAEWQAADAAYNRVVDVMDAARADLQPSLGAAAEDAFGAAYARLNDLDVALRSEDAVRVRALVAEIKRVLATLGGGGLGGAAGYAAQIAAWQQALGDIAGHRDAGRWIPMRNGALALYDSVKGQSAGLVAATGADGANQLAILRVFAMRLFVDALDQDKATAEAAQAQGARALTRLLELLGALRVTATPAAFEGQPRVRAYLASPGPDGTVTMPIKAENLPPGGLGSLRLEVRWSPAQLQLVDVQWSLGRGQTDRDDAAGVLLLSLPQAPTGNNQPTVVATLIFNLRGRNFDPRDYLPAGAAATLSGQFAAARRALRLGDLAAVGGQLTSAYLLLSPRTAPDAAPTVGDALAGAGRPERLPPMLLSMMEQVTEPSLRSEAQVTTDVLLEDLDRVEAALEDEWASYGAALRGADGTGLPVLIRVLSLTDTSGAALSPVLGVNGQVLLDAATPTPMSTAPVIPQPTVNSGAAGSGSVTPVGSGAAGGTPKANATGTAGGAGIATAAAGAPGTTKVPGGAGALWIIVVVLGLALVGAWAAGRRGDADVADA